jgi:glyoxylase-like metal-dependent hydrolase (beta-lactamase superfamily II)
MPQQIAVDDEALAPLIPHGRAKEIAVDLAYQLVAIVNVIFFGLPEAGPRGWVMIDAGLTGSAPLIRSTVKDRFGENRPPAAIILTHGHFDHVGALATLAEQWQAPIYAHPQEHPFLNGSASYPKPDATVGGGLMSLLAPFYPRGPIDVSRWLHPLPQDGSVPHMPGWRWLHTPGHAPGHVSLWRASHRSLVVGDAFITTAQESAFAVAMQAPELHGPPMYYTPDWQAAAESVRRLAALDPELVIAGHGPAMHGTPMRTALHRLAREFELVAVPHQNS